ncbi:MAG: hypothetical protein ABWZ99_08940 [Ilumatobacteraceae bacterium]
MKRRRAHFLPFLAVAAVAGFALGACGGGDGSALATLTGLTTTRPGLTAALPVVTVTSPLTTAEVTTSEIETTEIETTPPETTPVPPVTTFEPETTPVEPEQPAEPTAATTSTPWGWIILGLALAAALVAGILIWRRRQAGSAAWSRHMADLTQRCFVLLDDVLARGSVVTGHVQALAAEAQTLETRAPDDLSRRTAGRLRAQLADLAAALETDRALRLGSPPPSAEQLSYSTALIRQQVNELQGVLRPPGTGSTSA